MATADFDRHYHREPRRHWHIAVLKVNPYLGYRPMLKHTTRFDDLALAESGKRAFAAEDGTERQVFECDLPCGPDEWFNRETMPDGCVCHPLCGWTAS